jgi:hypothetical protein
VGKIGLENDTWNSIVCRYKDDIKKFGWVLKTIKRLEPVFGLISVDVMLKLFRFSNVSDELCLVSIAHSIRRVLET